MMDDFVFQDIDFFSSVESNEINDKSYAISSFENTTSKIKTEPKSHRLNPKVFECQHCSKEFNKNSNLNVHIRDLHGTYKSSEITCTTCEKEFKNPGSLKAHMPNHDNK